MTVDLVVERLGHHGDGIAPGPVFIPRVLPGECVSGTVTNGRLEAPRILTPSSERVTAPCPHYRRCGGCALQHADDAFVGRWRTGVIAKALEAQGLTAPMRATHVSPVGARRRATFSGHRTKKGTVVGFHTRASSDVTPVPDCLVITERLRAGLPVLARLTELGASRKSELRFVVTDCTNGLDAMVSGGKPLDATLRVALAEAVDGTAIVRLTWNEEPVFMARRPEVRFADVVVQPPPGAFLQATAEGETALRAGVSEALSDADRIADLFSGCGTFALPLARRVPVHAVESDAQALAALDHGWRNADGLRAVTTETRDLFRRPLLAEELSRFDGIVIDPPRAGAEAQIREIARSSLTRVAAVSCNPVTFARDAATLVAAGFRIDWLQVVDQFRWSPHVELVSRLSRD